MPTQEIIKLFSLILVKLNFLIAFPGQELKIGFLIEQNKWNALDNRSKEMRFGDIKIGEVGDLQVIQFLLIIQPSFVIEEMF